LLNLEEFSIKLPIFQQMKRTGETRIIELTRLSDIQTKFKLETLGFNSSLMTMITKYPTMNTQEVLNMNTPMTKSIKPHLTIIVSTQNHRNENNQTLTQKMEMLIMTKSHHPRPLIPKHAESVFMKKIAKTTC